MDYIAYLAAVRAALTRRSGHATLDCDDMPTIGMGHRYGVGPDDCACQIIADRADRMLCQD